MQKGNKVYLFVTAFSCTSLCSGIQNVGQWETGCRGGSAFSCRLPPLKVQFHMEQEVSLIAGWTEKPHSVVWVDPLKL